ncbi:hypothetical protein E2562_001127 [Oryza meyeriana var. granulata]|uniref:Uncharacterized protein n=1 Tax=Oryza meyeriana var. granulata TaxID=110450 RepID=A0A6G1EC96_9ORYZ|nr:hypothetical protein E2562_001127 [Oryza meyeriana var. granulata]
MPSYLRDTAAELTTTATPTACVAEMFSWVVVGFSLSGLTFILAGLRPMVLVSDPARTLQPKLDFLSSVGITAPLLPRLVSLTPIILHRSVEAHLAPHFDSLREVLGSDLNIVAALRHMPFVMRYSPKATFLRTLPVLLDVHGLTPSEVSKLVTLQPGVILLGPDRIGEIIQVVKNADVEPGSPMFVHVFAMLTKLKTSTLENKFAIYRSLGFDKEDVTVMLRWYPTSIGISEEKLKKTVSFLIGKAGLSREDIVTFPNILVRRLLPAAVVFH